MDTLKHMKDMYKRNNTKAMFKPGDVVQCCKLNGPNMIVESIARPNRLKGIGYGENKPRIKGILCFWFGANGEPFRKIFDTRDIELID